MRQFSVQRLCSLAEMRDTPCEFITADHDAPDMKPIQSQREADANIRVLPQWDLCGDKELRIRKSPGSGFSDLETTLA